MSSSYPITNLPSTFFVLHSIVQPSYLSYPILHWIIQPSYLIIPYYASYHVLHWTAILPHPTSSYTPRSRGGVGWVRLGRIR